MKTLLSKIRILFPLLILLFSFIPLGTQAGVSAKGKKHNVFHVHVKKIKRHHKPVTSDDDLFSNWEEEEEDEEDDDEQIAIPSFHKKFIAVSDCYQYLCAIPEAAVTDDTRNYVFDTFIYKTPSLSFLKTFLI